MNVSGDDVLPIFSKDSLYNYKVRLKFFNSAFIHFGTGYELEYRFHDSVISYLSKEGIFFGGAATLARVP